MLPNTNIAPTPPQPPGVLVGTAAIVVIVAGLHAAQTLVVPFFLAGFVSIIFAQPLIWLRDRGLPTWLALVIIVIAMACLALFFAVVIGESVAAFTSNLPFYQTRVELIMQSLQGWLQKFGITIPADILSSYLDVSAILRIAGGMLTGIGNLLTNGFMILLTIIFILLEAMSLEPKFRVALKNPEMQMPHLHSLMRRINQYMGIKTMTSLVTGVAVGVWLTILGVDFPILWGLLAFLLNYVPSIGSIIAAIPAVLLAFIQLGAWPAILAAIGYLVINNIMGAIVEPRIMGRGAGLSTLVVFVSLVFWGWVLGPVGMFLSVPLTMIVKLILDENKQTQGLGVLLGSEIPDSKPESTES
jgi:AI-2 transport protein TqsA